MTDAPDDIDHDAVWERVLTDPVYREFWKAQIGAELDQAFPLTCGDCDSVLLTDDYGNEYCPQCDD